MSYVVAIDVGIKNLGLCVFDFCVGKVVHWDVVNLVPSGRYVPMRNVEYIKDFLKRHEHFFENAHRVLIERQMRCNMRIIEAVLHASYYDNCTIISARSVKLHYDLSTKNYKQNKQKAVLWASSFLEANPHAFTPGVPTVWAAKGKRDDLADSLLLVMYYLDTYSNQLEVDNVIVQSGFTL